MATMLESPPKSGDPDVRKSEPQSTNVFVGRAEAARMLSVCARTIDNAIRHRKLTAFKIGKRVVIHQDALLKFATRLPVGQKPIGPQSRAGRVRADDASSRDKNRLSIQKLGQMANHSSEKRADRFHDE